MATDAVARQLKTTLILGAATGITLAAIGSIWYGKWTFGIIILVGMFVGRRNSLGENARSVGAIGPSRTAVLVGVSPVLSAAIAVTVLDEPLHTALVLGTLLVVMGIVRPGGDLIFLKNGTILTLCLPEDDSPATDHLLRDSFGLHRLEWADTGTVEFALPIGEGVRLFRANRELLDLRELRAPSGASTRYTFVNAEWAHRWPSEEIWHLKKKTT